MKDYQLSSTTKHMTFDLVLSIDHITPATGKTPTVVISKNGASYGAPSGAVTEVGNGTYKLAANASDRDTLGDFNVYVTATGCDPYREKYSIVAFDPYDSVRIGLTALPNANANSAGGLAGNVMFSGTASAGGSNTITLAGGSAVDNLYKYSFVQIISGTGAGQNRLIIDYNGTTKVATVSKSWATTPDNTSVFVVLPFAATEIAQSGLAQAGAVNTVTLSSTASAIDNTYVGQVVVIMSGTGVGQSRIIQSYVGSTKVATLDQVWATTPDNTSVYLVMSFGRSWADVFQQNGLGTMP